MEKRRRARINHSLSVLKSLIIKDEVGSLYQTEHLNFCCNQTIFFLFYFIATVQIRPAVRMPLHNHDWRRRIF